MVGLYLALLGVVWWIAICIRFLSESFWCFPITATGIVVIMAVGYWIDNG